MLTNPLCLDPRVAAGLGGDYPKWTFAIASSLGFDLTDKSVPPFLKVFKKYAADPKITADPWTPVGLRPDADLIKWLNTIGYKNITPAAIIKQAKAERGPVPTGRPDREVREVPRHPGGLQRPDAVLRVPRWLQVQAGLGLAQGALVRRTSSVLNHT